MKNSNYQHQVNWGNLFDYLAWRGDLTFEQSPFNAVDGLLFSVLAYLNLPSEYKGHAATIRESSQLLSEIPSEERYEGIFVMQDNAIRLANEAGNSRRFKNVVVSDLSVIHRESIEEQFGAITFALPDGSIFVAYRGTDDSLTGWKEDFNMAFICGTPSQLDAAAYLKYILNIHSDEKIRIGGHSKGGNLAVWAAAHMPDECRDRLDHIYNYDGPGFLSEFIESEPYQNITDKILSFVPASSLIGVLMGSCDYLTIKSNSLSLLQHDPFSWRIVGKRFDYVLERSKAGQRNEKLANDLIASLSLEERELYVEQIYKTLSEANVTSLKDLERNKFKHIFSTMPKLIKEGHNLKTSKNRNQ